MLGLPETTTVSAAVTWGIATSMRDRRAQRKPDVVARDRAETLELGRQRVDARLKRGKPVDALAIRDGGVRAADRATDW